MSEFIGHADSTDFRQISPEHSRDIDKRKCFEKNLDFHIFFPVEFIHATRLEYFSYSNFRDGYVGSQSKYRKTRHTFVKRCLVNKTLQLLVDKFNRRIPSRFTPYRLLTLHKRKTRLTCNIIVLDIY